MPSFGISYHLGVDGISLLLVLLTTFLMPLTLLASWHSVERRWKEFAITMLLLETGMLGVFVALDLFLFYIFWEAMLIPMYLIIGIWGGPNRVYAAVKFVLYTLVGSLLMLVAILVLYFQHGAATGVFTYDLPVIARWVVPAGAARAFSSSPSPSPSPSRCPCGRFTRGCPTRTWRRPRRAASSSPGCS